MEKEKKSGGALTLLLVLLVLALAGALAWIIFGEQWTAPRQEQPTETAREVQESGEDQASLAGTQSPNYVPIILPEGVINDGDTTPFAAAGEEPGEPPIPEDAMPEDSGESGETDTQTEQAPPSPPPAVDYATANARPAGIKMSTEDFTVTKIGQKTQLTASGGTGSYTWVSKNPAIATVDENGVVTAAASGTTNVIATDGEKKGVTIVRVKGLSDQYSLNRSDFTRSVEEGDYQLKVNGYDGAVSWRSSNPAVASVAADGTVTPVSAGFATITATFGEHSRQCFVHVTAG